MSSFVSRGAVLASARLLNQALALLSPLLLVRLLDIVDYGRYREFMAVAMLLTSLGGFALSANLTYLLARSPDRGAADVTKTTLLMFGVSLLSALVVVIGPAVAGAGGDRRQLVAAGAVHLHVPESRSGGCRTGWRNGARSR